MNTRNILSALVLLCLTVACTGPAKQSSDQLSAEDTVASDVTATSDNTLSESSPVDAYFGVWGCGRATVNISKVEESIEVYISWASSAAENTEWNYPCYYQPESKVLVCEGLGTKTDITYNDQGQEQRVVAYTEGRAIFEIVDGKLIWTDASESAGDDMLFVKE